MTAPAAAQLRGSAVPWPTTSSRNDVSMTSIPAMTRATIRGSALPVTQPAPAADRRDGQEDPAHAADETRDVLRAGREPGEAPGKADDGEHGRHADERGPDDRGRMDERVEGGTVRAGERRRDHGQHAQTERTDGEGARAHSLDPSSTSYRSPSTIRQARRLGPPVAGSASSSLSDTRRYSGSR